MHVQVGAYTLASIEALMPFLAPLPRLASALLRVMLALWSQNTPLDGGNTGRVYAYLRVRQMSLLLPGTAGEECFRAAYLAFARNAKTFSTVTSASVLFMTKCVAELYQTDPAMAYQQAFLYIRQLALHLRAAVQKKTAEASKQILNWQYLNCIRLWTRVVCAMPDRAQLGDLAFPLAQIVLGVLAAAPSAVNLPLRFHLVACMQQLAAHCQLFIPTAPKLLEVLEASDMFSKPAPSTEAPPSLAHIIRFLPEATGRANVRDLIVSEVVALLQQDAEVYRYNAGFPEYCFLTIRKLRAFAKKATVSRWRDLCRGLTNQLEQQSSQIKKLRNKLGKAPMDVRGFEALLPAGTDSASGRLARLMSGRAVEDVSEVIVSEVVGDNANSRDEELVQKKKRRVKSVGAADAVAEPKPRASGEAANQPDEVTALAWSDDEDE